MSSVDSITITSVSTVNQIEITSTSGITVTTVGTQGLAGPSAIMQKGVDATTIGSSGNGTFLVYDHANSQWTSSGSASVSNLTVELQKLRLGGTGATVVSILDEDNMASDSATALATQQSIKAYVESRVGIDNLAALLASGNTTGGTNIVVSANDDITFTDSSKALFGNSSDLQVYHDGTNSYITNSQGALKIATESSGITVNIGHTTSTVAIGDDLTVAGNQNITGTLGVTGTITGSLTGNVTGQVSDISNFTTANITENTNLYYTNERVDDQVNSLLIGGTGITLTYDDNAGTLTIDGQIGDITSVVAGDGLSGGGSSGDVTLTVNVDNSSVEINSDTLRVKALGISNDMLAGSITNSKLANADFTINSNSLVLGNSLTLDTDDIGEGSNNQYYTTSRANSDFDTRLATKTTDNLTEGSSSLYFTTARANTSIDNRVTKAFIDNLGVEASSVTANSVALGTDTTGNYIQTVSGTANKITVTGSGSESADITLTLPDDVQIADSLTVAGNLTVNGTLTSLDTTNLDIEDNLFQLNAGLTGSPVNDSGMLINRGNQNNGIFMWDESVDKFTMGLTTADGSATGNITLASLGTLVVNVEGNLTGAVTGNSSTATTLQTPRSIALSGDVSASAVNFDGSGNITLTTTIEANSIALGTDTVGNYVASITGGTGVTITGGTGESSTPSVAIGQAVGTTDDVTFNQVTADIIGNIEGATEFSASAGEALIKGDAVYISGVSGNKPVVSKADSDDANKMPSFGLVKADANLNANVSVVTFGTLAGLNTSSFSVGDTLYISTTAGGLTATAPTGESSLIQNIGKVQRSHASAGSIKVGGAGRTNATPNLNDGKIFLGNGSNQSVSTTLDSSVVPENTNLYYTDARVQAVSINNVVEDTTPQLGGNLASNGNDILFADNDKAIFGAGSDLQIYHDGSASYINDSGTGNLKIQGTQLQLQNAAGTLSYLAGVDGGATTIHHAGFAKLATTSTGINVTGTATMDGLVVDGNNDIQINRDGVSAAKIFWDRSGTTDAYLEVDSGENLTLAVDEAQLGSRLLLLRNNQTNVVSVSSSGIDVTGTATMDGLTVEGDTLSMSHTGNTSTISLTQKAGTQNSVATISANREDTTTSASRLLFSTNDGTSTLQRIRINNGGDISFYDDTGTSQALFWDASAESLGIGTTSPRAKLDLVSSTSATPTDFNASSIFIEETGNNKYGGLTFVGGNNLGNTGTVAKLLVQNTNTAGGFEGAMMFSTRNSSNSMQERLRIESAGNVGIGTTSPESLLHVKAADTVTGVIKIEGGKNTVTSNGEINSQLDFGSNDISVNNTGNIGGRIASVTETENGAYTGMAFYTFTQDASPDLSEKVRITHNGKVGIGETSPDKLLHLKSSGATGIAIESTTNAQDLDIDFYNNAGSAQGRIRYSEGAGSFNFAPNVSASDALIIDYSGNVLVGKTANDNTTVGGSIRAGESTFTANDSRALTVGRNNNNGDLIQFRKATATVGSISTFDGEVSFGRSSVGIMPVGSSTAPRIIPTNHDSNVIRDAAIDLGYSNARFKDLYLSGKANAREVQVTGTLGNWSVDSQGVIMDFTRASTSYIKASNAAGQLMFQTGGANNRMLIDSSGVISADGVYNTTSSDAANVRVLSNGNIVRSTSSRKYKNSITDASKGLTELNNLRPVTYKGNNDGETVFYGLIAEEVHDVGLTEFVEYNDDNEPDALRYPHMVSLCIKAIQEQQTLIDDLKSRIETLEG